MLVVDYSLTRLTIYFQLVKLVLQVFLQLVVQLQFIAHLMYFKKPH